MTLMIIIIIIIIIITTATIIIMMLLLVLMMMMMILLLLLLLIIIMIIIIIIIIIIIMLIMIIIAFTGAIPDFLQSPHCTANRLQHVHSSGPGAIVCKSPATHRALVTYNIVRATWYERTAQILNLT